MKSEEKCRINLIGEFKDRELENEFLYSDMKYYSKYIGIVALIFGVIYMIFIIDDYFSIGNREDFRIILFARVLFLIFSIAIYLFNRKVKEYRKLVYLVTVYEIWAIFSFLLIIYKYDAISFLSFFSVLAITFAIYIIPNRLILAQIIAVLLNSSFLILYANKVEDLSASTIYKIAMYIFIFIIFGNIEGYITNFYRRKQFIVGKKLEKLSETDTLTGIYNRGRFDQELNLWVDYCLRYGNPLSLVIFDIDDFKEINDKYGHLVGDSILQSVTALIKDGIRSMDIFARWGGDEFVILLPNTNTNQAIDMMERLRVIIMNHNFEIEDKITCSFGVVSLQDGEDAKSILQKADKLLYKAKGEGKNNVSHEFLSYDRVGDKAFQ